MLNVYKVNLDKIQEQTESGNIDPQLSNLPATMFMLIELLSELKMETR
jgi:hypothetical protein